MIIDVHGHYTTAPDALGAWRDRQVAAVEHGTAPPSPEDLRIGDDELRESVAANQLRQMDARGIDLTVFSPRASFMAHHVGDLETSRSWARICNELCARVAGLFPGRFAPAAMLAQSPGAAPATCVPDLERAIAEHDVVAVNLNPDPSGGHWTAPPLTDRSWYPLYEALCAHDLPAMVHVSTSVNPAFHTTGAHYLNADTTVFMQLLQGDLFADFPQLRLVIPHGGGAVPYHWGRFRGLAQALGKPDLEEHLLGNVFLDTCVYHQVGIDLLLDVVPVANVLFASEMIGAVRGVDPRTGQHFDDTRRYVEAAGLPPVDLTAVLEGNARRVYPRLARFL
ncbi:4-oxalomesaconate hydratase [Tersicoccus solisilvae]|uniref:4-oxalomesaconate hydratase n=1 Tax=Tersicoccus solisilvae TaxID=1882339 RepID=A0ABQ1NYA7_9MICC|nr:amidohydrolase family protein [Tersicoccus solisilvae]GGC85462.1 4-oxalomesaconate hydratase [Tersicoccus solisilvae]